MLVNIGIVVASGAVVAGYLVEHGHLKVLVEPAELVIIGGAAIGTAVPLSLPRQKKNTNEFSRTGRCPTSATLTPRHREKLDIRHSEERSDKESLLDSGRDSQRDSSLCSG